MQPRAMAKAGPTNFVMRSQCTEDISKQRLVSLINPENDNGKERARQASGHSVNTTPHTVQFPQ